MGLLLSMMLAIAGPDEDAAAALALAKMAKKEPQKETPKAAPATLVVTVPANAQVWINGKRRTSDDGFAVRKFFVPPINEPGYFTIKVVLGVRTETRDVVVEPGKTTRAAFTMEGGVSLPALPFPRRIAQRELGRAADGSLPWPAILPIPDGLTVYSSTRVTQQSFDRNITGKAFISWVSRTSIESRWNAPGGLDGVPGWSSTTLKAVPSQVREWRGPESNEVYAVQAYHRTYPVGTLFVDFLENDHGEPFEIRYREKTDRGWDSYVAWKNRNARPVGYTPPRSRDCRACHEQAGVGGYATARVPGGDTVFGDPFVNEMRE